MTDKVHFDLDAALAALATDEKAARPAVSGELQVRVLGDAAEIGAEIAAGIAAERAGATASLQNTLSPRKSARAGGFRLFGLFDAWSGAAAAAVMLCLAGGLGLGYESGPELMAQAGLADAGISVMAENGDGAFLSEDIL
jgi:hypothetical protein